MHPEIFLLKAKPAGLIKDSVVNVSQIITINKSFLIEKIGELSNIQLDELEQGIKLVLGLR
jgi:mRNA interferase MazF